MAESARNPIDSYDLTVETKINIDEMIKILNADDMPMLAGLNSDGYPLVSKEAVDNTIFYWQSQERPTPRATLNTTMNDAVASLVLTAGGGLSFAAGDAVRVDNEVLFVTAVTTDTLTVTRGNAGTTAAAHTAPADVIGLGTIIDEGDIGTQQFSGRDKFSNYTQIWTSQINVTRTSERIPKYGVPSNTGELVAQVMLSEGINMEQAFLYGVKWQSDPRRATGGLAHFITDNVIANGASGNWLTVQEIEKRQQVAYDAGGMFTHIVSRPKNFQALNNVAGAERIQTVEVSDSLRGRKRAQYVMTEFGEVYLHRNRYVKATDAFGINPGDLKHRVFQPMIVQPLAKTDDRNKWMFVAEGGFQINGQEHMVRWTGLDNTASLPAGLV
jgi:hypothetical protein